MTNPEQGYRLMPRIALVNASTVEAMYRGVCDGREPENVPRSNRFHLGNAGTPRHRPSIVLPTENGHQVWITSEGYL
jgi:hypothetical protein